MVTPLLKIKPLKPELGKTIPWPQKMSVGAAGYDLAAAIEGKINLLPGERQLIPCGFAIAVPEGFEAQVRPRSGLAVKYGIGVLNSPGTIDSDYRGEVKVLLVNFGQDVFVVEPGMRIAQLVIARVIPVEIRIVEDLELTSRGNDGFGSTGV